MSAASPSIALVVLNWNGVSDTLDCLASLRESVTPVHAIVVDNGSAGSDVAQIRASGLADELIETGSNLGYAAGNNFGLQHALENGFEIVGVLNNDTLVDPRCFGGLVRHLVDSEGTTRAIAPTMLYADDPVRAWFAGGVVESGWPRHLQPEEVGDGDHALRPSEWLTGCCILARAETWGRVGLFDPRYYLIFEDADWSLRARRLNVELVVSTESTIRHKVSGSSSTGAASLLSAFYFVRNGLRFNWAYGRRHLPRFLWVWLLDPTVRRASRMTRKGELDFRWAGAFAFACGLSGRAPRPVERLAQRRSRADQERVA